MSSFTNLSPSLYTSAPTTTIENIATPTHTMQPYPSIENLAMSEVSTPFVLHLHEFGLGDSLL
jgi:hypothetical protein